MAAAVTFWNICFRFAHEFINVDCHEMKLNPVINTCIFITLRPIPSPLHPPTPHLTLGFVFVEFLIW